MWPIASKGGHRVIKEVGFDYNKVGRERAYDELSEDEYWEVRSWELENGPYFLLLQPDEYQYYPDREPDREGSKQEQFDRLESTIHDFLDFLRSQGVI